MKIISKILCLCSVLFLASCKDYIIPSTWNYRITVEIETPEGIKTGSAVRQVRAWRNLVGALPDAPEIEYEVIGEAVVVDLGERGVVFALINWSSYEEVYKAFPPTPADDVNKYGTFKSPALRLKHYRELKPNVSVELKERRPKMIAFTDENDPKSLVILNNRTIKDIYGDSVILKQVLIEITNDHVTHGVDEKIQFLYGNSDFLGWQKSLKYGDLRIVSHNNFKRGIK